MEQSPQQRLLANLAVGNHLSLPRKELPGVRERYVQWATARKLTRKRAERDLDEAAA